MMEPKPHKLGHGEAVDQESSSNLCEYPTTPAPPPPPPSGAHAPTARKEGKGGCWGVIQSHRATVSLPQKDCNLAELFRASASSDRMR